MSSKTKLHYSGCNHIPGVQPKCPECTIERLRAELILYRTGEAYSLAAAEIKHLTAERDDLQYANDFCGKTIERLQARVEALEGVVKAAHDELMNLQPHIPECCYPQKQPFIDAHVDVAMELLATTEQGESDG